MHVNKQTMKDDMVYNHFGSACSCSSKTQAIAKQTDSFLSLYILSNTSRTSRYHASHMMYYNGNKTLKTQPYSYTTQKVKAGSHGYVRYATTVVRHPPTNPLPFLLLPPNNSTNSHKIQNIRNHKAQGKENE